MKIHQMMTEIFKNLLKIPLFNLSMANNTKFAIFENMRVKLREASDVRNAL